MTRFLFSIALITLLFGCDRKEFKTYLGTYNCNRLEAVSMPDTPTENVIETGFNITVNREKKSIVVFEHIISIDSLEQNTTYFFSKNDAEYSILFFQDEMYYEEVRDYGDSVVTIAYNGARID